MTNAGATLSQYVQQPLVLERDFYALNWMQLLDPILPRWATFAMVMREKAVGTAIPDIVFGAWRVRPSPVTRHRLSHNELLVVEHVITKQLHVGEIRQNSLGGHYFSDLGAIVERLRQRGFLTIENDAVQLVRNAISTPDCMLAVEAKLNALEMAATQALSYRSFAHRSYVLLLRSRQLRTDERDALSALGVGLIVLSSTGIHKVLSPRESRPAMHEHLVASQKLAHYGLTAR